MTDRLQRRLELHRADYESVAGKPFEHFFCPILFVDEPIKPQEGHIINEAFKGAPNTWVVQRSDVDSFFGSYFEGDFELSQYMRTASTFDYFLDKKLFGSARPRVFIDDQQVHYFLWLDKAADERPPRGFEIVEIEEENTGKVVELCVKVCNSDPRPEKLKLRIRTEKDLRLAAFVSLLKSAHLSMFSLFGYRYALSHAGRFIGHDLLGKFYMQNRRIRCKKTIQRNALAFFRPYKYMVQPIPLNAALLAGTMSDGIVALCAGATDLPWGMIVYVKTAEDRSAVLIPCPEEAASFATYHDFLKNDHEQVHIMVGQHQFKPRRWTFNPQRLPALWLKNIDSYPRRLE